jgi:hypothetical protein
MPAVWKSGEKEKAACARIAIAAAMKSRRG